MTQILVVTGTSTDVGKTIAVAALAAAARADGLRVAVCKPAQTGVRPHDPGDLTVVTDLVGALPTAEVARYRQPLAPETAARRAGAPFLTLDAICAAVQRLAVDADLVLVEGAGGVLVRLAPDLTLLDVAVALDAPAVVVTDPGLGTLNHTELTVDALRAAGVAVAGLILGAWPDAPDLAMTCNRDDLPRLTGAPVVAAVPAGMGAAAPQHFQAAAPTWFTGPPLWAAPARPDFTKENA
ncbi:dethiobiotin synthase [Gordonia alkaliphila]|uniref:dethiobiotin synthase n=1 Tax=Gordonia alkaliphila TaxID=1053547 RepID=UPI001FF48187|nr:dethiobiotin synthase [Gordonia alkaliphila]MCK0440917.1 dethiobiotin synthase [Gordonia alkaliphila]